MSVEFVDKNALIFIRQKTAQVPVGARAAIYIEQDIQRQKDFDKVLEIWLEYIEEANAIDSWAEMDDQGIERHKAFRHALPSGVHEFIKKFGVSKLATDLLFQYIIFQRCFSFILILATNLKLTKEYKIPWVIFQVMLYMVTLAIVICILIFYHEI